MSRTRVKRGLRWVGVGLVTVGILTAVMAWRFWPRERLLMEVARPIVKLEPEHVGYSAPEDEEAYWLAADQLLIITPGPTNQNGIYRRDSHDMPVHKTWQGSADLLNTTTHTRTHLPVLTHLIDRTTVRPLWRPDSFEISPDGVWLQWQTYGGTDGWPLPRAAHLDGTHYREWFRDKRGQESFFLDSRHLCQIEANADPPMKIRDLQDPKLDQERLTPNQANAALAQYAAHQPTLLDVPALREERAFEVLIAIYRMQDRLQLRRAEWAFAAHEAPKPIWTKTLKMPTGAMLRDGALSPQQEALCFEVRSSRTPPLLAWLHRLFPRVSVTSVDTEEMWVSRADGGGMREIGHVLITPTDDYNSSGRLKKLQWLPDGKQISFLYHDTLYVAPARPGSE